MRKNLILIRIYSIIYYYVFIQLYIIMSLKLFDSYYNYFISHIKDKI